MKRLLQGHGHQIGFHDRDRPFGDGRRNGSNIDRLKILLRQPGARRLPRDAQNGNRIGGSGIKPGDHVGSGRPRRTEAQADVAAGGAGIAFGHVRSSLDMPCKDMADGATGFQRRVKRIDSGPRHAEGAGNSLFLQNENGSIDSTHSCHGGILQHNPMLRA
jgi:hypothetical protein